MKNNRLAIFNIFFIFYILIFYFRIYLLSVCEINAVPHKLSLIWSTTVVQPYTERIVQPAYCAANQDTLRTISGSSRHLAPRKRKRSPTAFLLQSPHVGPNTSPSRCLTSVPGRASPLSQPHESSSCPHQQRQLKFLLQPPQLLSLQATHWQLTKPLRPSYAHLLQVLLPRLP